jgi:uncharacterized protein YijF (DUF1287 family)
MKNNIAIILVGAFFIVYPAIAQNIYEDNLFSELVEAAIMRVGHSVTYDGSYRGITYPGGDVPDDIGVCTDVIIRVYREVEIDLQRKVHEDMKSDFSAYPNNWGLTKPDKNIDHRRVPNLQIFFKRKGTELPVTSNARDYKPGDLVTWIIPGNLPHIGIVINKKSSDGHRYMIVHNIGRGPKIEDILFQYPITGHYRYPKI